MSFCFDDFPRSAYVAGGGILLSFGVRSTYYASARLMGTSNALGQQFTCKDLDALLADGHELGSHTFNHLSCRSVPLRVFCKDVQKGREEIRRLTGYDPSNFAYPYGHVSLMCKQQLGTQVGSARGIFGGVNGPQADLNLLRANSLYGDADTALPAIHQLIADTVHKRGWLILYTHDVTRDPSPFGCTPSLLDAAVDYTLQSGCRIIPIQEAIATFSGASITPSASWPDHLPASTTRS